MEVEQKEQKKKCNVKKYHVDDPKDTELAEMKDKYELIKADHQNNMIPFVAPEDVHSVIEKYSSNLDVDLYTVAETFSISATTLTKLLKKEEYRDEYLAAKQKRGELLAQKGLEVAFTPYKKLMAGEEIPSALVKAAALASNYSLSLAKSLNPELNPQKTENVGSQNIAVVVNTSVDLNV